MYSLNFEVESRGMHYELSNCISEPVYLSISHMAQYIIVSCLPSQIIQFSVNYFRAGEGEYQKI